MGFPVVHVEMTFSSQQSLLYVMCNTINYICFYSDSSSLIMYYNFSSLYAEGDP